MSEEDQTDGKEATSEVVLRSKPTKETWLNARIDYESGNFGNMRELAEKYSLDYKALRDKAHYDEWIPFSSTVSNTIRQKVQEKVENKVEKLFANLELKAERYEKMIQASQSQAAQTQDAIPVLDPDQIECYAKTESRIIDWQKLALGINDKLQVQGTVDINVISILQKLKVMPERTIDVEAEVSELKEMVKLLAE